MSALSVAAALLQSATSGFSGASIVYTRGASSTKPIAASTGKTQLAVDDSTFGRLEMESHDFIIPAAALVIGTASLFPPAEGDRIVCAGVAYEVMSTPYRLSDAAGVNLRIHTKRVS